MDQLIRNSSESDPGPACRLLLLPAVQRPVSTVIVLTSFDPGGTERQMLEVIRRLDRSRFEVHAICFRREGPWLRAAEEAAASVTEFRLGSFASMSAWRQLGRLAAWLRHRRIEVLHASDVYANIVALPAAALARVPVRIGSRRGIVSPTPQRSLLLLQRAAYAAAHRIVANSAAAAARLRREGVSARRITVVPNGIDLQQFRIAPRDAPALLTMVANFRPGKGHDVLLRALARVVRRRPDVRLQLVGDGPLRPAIEHQARALALDRHVAFLGHRDDVAAVLAASGAFVLPSLMEAFPNSVMEAMATGLPVVATGVGGIPELVAHGHTGLLVAPGDDAALAAAMLQLLDDEDRARALAADARRSIETRFSFERTLQAFEHLYLTELAARRGTPDPSPVDLAA